MVRRPRIALLAALACLAGLGVTLVLAYFAPPFGGRDAATLQGFVDLNRPRLTPLLSDVAHLADPAPYGLIGLALVVIALARHRGRVALAIAVVLICSAVTSSRSSRCSRIRARRNGWARGRSPRRRGRRATRRPRWRSRCARCSPCRRRWRPAAAAPAACSRSRSPTRSSRSAGTSRRTCIGGFLVAALWTRWRSPPSRAGRAAARRAPSAVTRSALAAGAARVLVGAARRRWRC